MGSVAKVVEVDLEVGNEGGSSDVVGKDGCPSETLNVEDRRDVISSLVVGSIVDVILATAVDSPMTGKGEPGDSFPKSLVDASEVNLGSFELPVGM